MVGQLYICWIWILSRGNFESSREKNENEMLSLFSSLAHSIYFIRVRRVLMFQNSIYFDIGDYSIEL